MDNKFKFFSYNFSAGPLASAALLKGAWQIGNCRRAIQYYLWRKKKIFLPPEKVLCPYAYYETGVIVTGGDEKFSFQPLVDADIIYAEKIRDKDEAAINKSRDIFATEKDYIVSLHTAIYTGEPGKEICHATAIEGGSCFWPLEKFLYFYRPVLARRI